MEEIEQQIYLITKQIEEVSSDIKTIECVLAKDFTSWSLHEKRMFGNEEEEARKQLRREKEKLRKKEEQLRREKEQLRELLIEKERQKTQGLVMKEG